MIVQRTTMAMESEGNYLTPSPAFAATTGSAPTDQERKPLIPIREILMEVVETLEPAIPQGMRITLNVTPDISVRANPDDVFSVLLNIIRNAIDVAIGSGAEFYVRITGGTTGGRTSVMISDSGPGLPVTVRHKFDLLAKAPENRPGHGRGLAIAQHLARINGGKVRIAATGAFGTIFEIVLPGGSAVIAP
jgi:signal transduction histidine kinase